MQTRGIIIIGGIFAIIMVVIIMPDNSISVKPGLQDNPQIYSDTALDVSPSDADVPAIVEKDAISTSNQDGPVIIENDVMSTGNQDGPVIHTNTSLNVSPSNADGPAIMEKTVISPVESNVSFYIDENGTKHFTIVSVDIPTIHGK